MVLDKTLRRKLINVAEPRLTDFVPFYLFLRLKMMCM